jgi:hypothetical protein
MTVQYIKSVIQNAIAVSKTYRNQNSIEKIIAGMNESLAGINSLIVTYTDDATVSATLQVLHDRILTSLQEQTQ